MAVLIKAYTTIGEPHRRVTACSTQAHVVAISSNEVEDDWAVRDLVVGMCYDAEGDGEFGYWANDNAVRFHEALAGVSSELPAAARDPFFAFLDCDPTRATFGPQSCSELAADFATWRDAVRPRLVALDEMFGTFYDQLGAAYLYGGDGAQTTTCCVAAISAALA
jgi:hypothetical protein